MTYDEVKVHSDYTKYASRWTQLSKCMEGEEAIKAAREVYLPYPVRVDEKDQTTVEFKAMYTHFLTGAHFVEYTAEAVEDLISSAFRRPIEVKRASSTDSTEIVEDLGDLDYLDLEDIGKEIVGGVGAYGRMFVLVDYPTVATTPNMAEDITNKAYFTLYEPLNVLNWTETKRSGKSELTRVVLREIDELAAAEENETLYSSEISTDSVRYLYRELIMVEEVFTIRIYRENKAIVTLVPKANGQPFTEIPGVFVGTTSNTAKVDKSPVMGISNSNLKHYQTWAELMFVQTYVGHPQLVLSGLAPGWNKQAQQNKVKIKMDAAEVLALEGEHSTANLLEIDTNALMHYRTLEVLEQSMSEQGARIKAISKKAGVESAQALKIRSSASMSKLASIVDNASDALTRCLGWVNQYMGGSDEDYIVQINKEFYSPEPDGPFLTAVSNAEATGTAPRGTALTYLKQIELVDDNISNEVYLKDMELVSDKTEAMPNKQQGAQTTPNNKKQQ